MRNKKNIRTCKACREKKEKKELYRIYIDKDLNFSFEENKSSFGKGVYLCKNEKCIDNFFSRKNFLKDFKLENLNNVKELYKLKDKIKSDLKNKNNI